MANARNLDKSLYDLVREQLLLLPCRKKRSRKNVLIECPFHPDRDPSCSVNVGNFNLPPGIFHCFGCGASGNWNELASKLGLKKINEEDLLRVSRDIVKALLKRSPDEYSLLNEWVYKPPSSLMALPEDFVYLGRFPSKFLKRFMVKLWFDPVLSEKRLWFPVFSSIGILVGHVTLPLSKESKAKVRYSPGNWVSFSFWNLPYILGKMKSLGFVVLVEGIKDALALLQVGIPALAILGSSTVWNRFKRDLICLNFPKVFLAFDGDLAGYKTTVKVYEDLRSKGVEVIPIKLPKGKDPFDLSKGQLTRLKEVVLR